MIAKAPGKLFLTGAWAVLEGAPALVMGVDRYVRADASRPDASPARPEIAAVARRMAAPAPSIDATALEERGRKLGLGSSAAGAVAAAGAIAASRGEDVRDPAVRARVLEVARAAHEESQPRGSGGDLAAATYGGVVSVRRRGASLEVHPLGWLNGLCFTALAVQRPMRTSDALDRFAGRANDRNVRIAMAGLSEAAERGANAWSTNDVRGFLAAAAAHVEALGALGNALDLPLVPEEVNRARQLLTSNAQMRATDAHAVLLPSGAGGGDVVLHLGIEPLSSSLLADLSNSGLSPLPLSLDHHGLHVPRRATSPREDSN